MNSVTRRRTIKNLANFTFIGNSTATWAILLAMLFDADPERLVYLLVETLTDRTASPDQQHNSH